MHLSQVDIGERTAGEDFQTFKRDMLIYFEAHMCLLLSELHD